MQYDALRRQVGDSDEIWGYLRYFIDLHRLLHSCEPRQAWKDWHRLRRAAWVERSNANSSNWNCNLYTSLEAFHVWILIEFPQLPDWLSLVMMSIWCECIFFQMVFEIQWESNCSTQQCSYCVLVGHTCVYIYIHSITTYVYVRTYVHTVDTYVPPYVPISLHFIRIRILVSPCSCMLQAHDAICAFATRSGWITVRLGMFSSLRWREWQHDPGKTPHWMRQELVPSIRHQEPRASWIWPIGA